MGKKKVNVSAIVLTHNSEKLIDDCLKSLSWVDEVIIVDDASIDRTLEKVKKYNGVKIVFGKGNFSTKRNSGAKVAGKSWLLYVDDDERVTPELKGEIISVISQKDSSVKGYAIPRKNIYLGREMKYGGWRPDYVLRLIKKDALIKWEGKLHEQPKIKGEIGKLNNKLTHIGHRSLEEMVAKTNEWSEIEAKLLFDTGHPKMNVIRFFSAGFREFWFRGVRKLGFLDGVVGVIEIMYQVFSKLITYSKLWEMQIKKNVKD